MIMTAKKFSETTGFPLMTIRRLCREKKLPHWKVGRTYLLDDAKAMTRLQMLTETAAPEAQQRSYKSSKRRYMQEAENGTARLRALLKQRKTRIEA